MRYILLGLLCLVISSPAEARKRKHVQVQQSVQLCIDIMCIMSGGTQASGPTANSNSRRRVAEPAERVSYSSQTTMLPHPEGCPRRAFCGCGASIEKFGRNIRSLWLARAWFRFPRDSAAPGRAMVRSHHVAILRSHVSGTLWMVADYNSGGHQSRLHVRDIRGWTIVNPS